MAALRIFIPASHVNAFYAAARRSIDGSGVLVLEKPAAVLHLESLACMELAIVGSSWRCRTPYVFPLLATPKSPSYADVRQRPLEAVAGADWVVLGGEPEVFARALRLALETHAQTARIIPFLSVGGELARTRQKDDVQVRLAKQWFFVNHVAVSQVMDQLLALPEERWGETGYVAVVDHYPTFRPLIEAGLARPPKLILELGCGLGQMARSLAVAYPQARVIGLDVSRESLNVARKTFCLPNLEYKEFDFARRYAFEDGEADLIVSSSALNISSNQARTAAETLRILAPDGLLVNGCILEPYHEYWDFPSSAFLPTRSNLLPWDWLEAARTKGLGLDLHHWSRANSPHYFASARVNGFDALYKAMVDSLDYSPLASYSYTHCTAFMSIGGIVPAAAAPLVPPSNHLEAMEHILAAYENEPPAGQVLTEVNWLAVCACHNLFPEATQYLCACLPRAAHIIRHILDPNLLKAIRPEAA